MSGIVRKESLSNVIEGIKREIERMLDEFYATPFENPMWDFTELRMEPLTDVTETENEVIVTADLPLTKKENVKIRATEDSLEIHADTCRAVKIERWGSVQRECEFSSFHKILSLPAKVNPKKLKTQFKDGYIRIRLPKRLHARK
jgi:HSP20 family protein